MEEGIRKGVFKGLGASCMRETTSATVRLGMFAPVKRALGVNKESNPILKCVAGGIVGAMGAISSNPSDMIKVRMQAHQGEYQSAWWHISKIYQNYGVIGFWKGLNAGIQRSIVLNFTKLGTYDIIKHKIIDDGYLKDGLLCQFVASIFAGFFTAVTSTPVDNIKTRLQNQRKSGGA